MSFNIRLDMLAAMKPVRFLGDSLECLRAFPPDARNDAGYQLELVQDGRPAADFKPMPIIGRGVEELRVWVESGTYRVIYLARLANIVVVLHAFQKKTQATPAKDLGLAKRRYREFMKDAQ